MRPQPPLREAERENWDFFLSIPEYDRRLLKTNTIKGAMVMQPLFEFSGACVGCGETPYIKLASQLFGDRMVIANATGCSSIYGGNLPTTPWTKNAEGRGPAWSNSLFEDNAEFGLGMRVAIDKQNEYARELVASLRDQLGGELVDAILDADQSNEAGIYEQRERVATLKQKLQSLTGQSAETLLQLADSLCKKSVWIIGGDGWAYDIGFGGVDHVLASGRNVNILVLDTEVYSNTGGQTSKSTPLGAVAKFSARAKRRPKKIWPCWRWITVMFMSPMSLMRVKIYKPSMRFWRQKPTTARLLSSPTRLVSRTVWICPTITDSKIWLLKADIGRCSGLTPVRPNRAKIR